MTTGLKASRVAIVSGASSGIGYATVDRLVRDGFTIAAMGRRVERLARPGSDAVLPLPCDVVDGKSLAQAVEHVVNRYGRIDAVVTCAGAVRRAALESMELDEIGSLIAVNLIGTVNLCRLALPQLKASRGAIVTVGSTLSQRPTPDVSIYAATKGAVEAFTRALAIEVAPHGVRVNCVMPALVRSEIWLAAGMAEEAYARLLEERGRTYPLGRVGEPEDVAAAIAFLLSIDAGWMTGTCIPVDGGSSIGSRAPVPKADQSET